MIGRTKDAGWEIGVSKTIPYSVDEVWDLMTSPAGIAVARPRSRPARRSGVQDR